MLENYFLNYVVFVEKILCEVYILENFNGIILEEDWRLIGSESVIFKKFSFELFCNIFEFGVCDEYCGCFLVGWRLKEESILLNF